MASELQQQVIPPAYDGIDSDSAPDLIPLTKAPVVDNLLVDSPGRLPMRGPINTRLIQLESYPTAIPIGFWTNSNGAHGNGVLVGYKRGIAGMDPWVTPYGGWVTRDVDEYGRPTLAQAATVATYVDLRFGTTTRVTVTRDTAPGPQFAIMGEYTYGPALDSSATAIQQGQRYVPRALLKWQDATSNAPTVVANAPDISQDVIVHLNRLWVLGGRDIPSGAGSPPIEHNTLFYSVAGGPQASDPRTSLTPESANSWKDFSETTQNRPRTNKIVIGADNNNDFGVGLARVGQNLVIFKRNSMYVLSGYDPSNFQVRQFSDSVGCLDARSIVQWEDGVFFLAEQGYMFFDGAKLTNFSEGMKRAIGDTAYASVGGPQWTPTNSFAVATRLPNDYIALCIGQFPSTVRFSGLLHVPRRAWCSFSSDALPLGAPLGFGRGSTVPFMVSGGYLARSEWITRPETAPLGAYGVDTLTDDFTWTSDPNLTTFSGTDDSLRNTETTVSLFPSTVGTQYAIPARWKSRLFPLSSPFYKAQLHRVLLEYNAKFDGGADGQDGWVVTVQDGSGNDLQNQYAVPGQGDPTRFPSRRTNVRDAFSEAVDAQVVVEWDRPPVPLRHAEILSSAIEFLQASQSRGT